MWQQHCSGTHDHGFGLWTVFSLLLWEQRVFQQVKQVATARS
jgi:hypothetical protein